MSPLTDVTGIDERVLILAPTGSDAAVAIQVLARGGIHSEAVKDLEALCCAIPEGAGGALIAEEAISAADVPALRTSLAEQEPWSDIPIILMTSTRERFFALEEVMTLFAPAANISILERPFHVLTLISAVRVALRARRRQYQVRYLLRQQDIALRQREEFLSVASHELRTPLTTLKLQAQTKRRAILEGDSSVYSPAKVNALIQMTERQTDRLAHLVDDMLDISRIVNGKLALTTSLVELGALVSDIIESIEPALFHAPIPIQLVIFEKVSGLWDRNRIEQVVTNLITNALKYGQGNPIRVTVSRQDHLAVLEVEDQGMGIAPEHQERVFQRFERATADSGISGLGLGLYITRQIVELHGGKVSVKSEPGKGATFRVELPTAPSR